MTILTADSSELGARRGLLPVWTGVVVYAALLLSGNKLLIDPDTMWQVTLGQWIIDNRAVPQTDIYSFTMAGQPWISTQWLSQVLLAASYALAGWAGPVMLSAAAAAITFALYAHRLGQRLRDPTTLVFVAVALALMIPHLLARPHVLAMPVMVAFVGALIAAADRREAPSFWLLPLIVLWANLHGGFVLGIALIAPIGLDAVLSSPPQRRLWLLLRWGVFGVVALIVSCANPYGWNAILASQRILSLGEALATIGEWAPVNFSRLGAFEIALLGAIGLSMWRGVRLPPVRILMLLGLLHMALSQNRNIEVLALLAPLIIAAPLARQVGGAEPRAERVPGGAIAAALALTIGGTLAITSIHRFTPNTAVAPVAAVAELKKLGVQRVFNDYDFGGYLIANGVQTFIDGRTELFGEPFVVEQNLAVRLKPPQKLFRLLEDYNIDATLLPTKDAAPQLLDHVDGWQKVYSDEIATIHLRKPGALRSAEPKVTPGEPK